MYNKFIEEEITKNRLNAIPKLSKLIYNRSLQRRLRVFRNLVKLILFLEINPRKSQQYLVLSYTSNKIAFNENICEKKKSDHFLLAFFS